MVTQATNIEMTEDDINAYLFPDPELLELDNDELRRYIKNNLRHAKDQTDGTDCMSDVRIDFAQDTIGQARDILLSRGITFSQYEQNELSFLCWESHN